MAGLLKVRARVKGERQVRNNLVDLAKALEGREMATALLAGARVYARKMKELVPRRSGQTQNAIYAFNAHESDFVRGKGSRRLRIRLRDNEAMAVAGGPLSHLIEFGSKGRRITTPKRKQAIKLADGRIYARVDSGRMPAKPFWRPAFWSGRGAAVTAVQSATAAIVAKRD